MKRKNVFFIILITLSAFLFFCCGINEEDIKLKTPEQICADMNKKFNEDFEILDYHLNDGPEYKGISLHLHTNTFSEETIIAMYGYHKSIFGWSELNQSNYNYFCYKDRIESKYTEKINDYFAGINYKAVNASKSQDVFDDMRQYNNNLEEYLKATDSIKYYICFNEKSGTEVPQKIKSIKNEMINAREPVQFYFFLVPDIESLSETEILDFDSNDAFDDSFTF